MWLSDLILTWASAYGSSQRQDSGQRVPLVCFMSLFNTQWMFGLFSVGSSGYVKARNLSVSGKKSVSESSECSQPPLQCPTGRQFETRSVLFTLPSTPLSLPGIFWVCMYHSTHMLGIQHTRDVLDALCICNIHYLSAGTSSPVSEYAGLSVVPWMSWKLELIGSCALSQVHPEHSSCQATSLLIDQTGPGNLLPNC